MISPEDKSFFSNILESNAKLDQKELAGFIAARSLVVASINKRINMIGFKWFISLIRKAIINQSLMNGMGCGVTEDDDDLIDQSLQALCRISV